MLTHRESEGELTVSFCFFGERLFGPARRRHLTALCRCRCHLQCFDTQLDLISVWFFFPVVCVWLIEHSLNLEFVLTSGTCGTAALTTPLKVVEASCISIRLISFRVAQLF